jgi:transposase InsO family protein
MPEAMRLYRENIALKAQLDALTHDLRLLSRRPRASLRTRAAQVFALMLTRDDRTFHRYYLSAALGTIQRWASRFRHGLGRRSVPVGRPPLAPEIVELILTLKRENRGWGQQRIEEELRRMGIRVHKRTIAQILVANGFAPHPGRGLRSVVPWASDVKDALWALDFFAVQLARGAWVQVLLVIDLATREMIELRVHDGWDVDSRWTTRVFHGCSRRTQRTPSGVVHDHGTHFLGQFSRQLRVLGVEEHLTPVALPQANAYVERAIGTIRAELLRHVVVASADELQALMDEFRVYATTERAHQGLDGQAPQERARGQPVPDVLSLEALRRRKLCRRPYAHGLLNGYSLEERQAA